MHRYYEETVSILDSHLAISSHLFVDQLANFRRHLNNAVERNEIASERGSATNGIENNSLATTSEIEQPDNSVENDEGSRTNSCEKVLNQ